MPVLFYASREPTSVIGGGNGQSDGDEYADGGGEEGGAILLYTDPRPPAVQPLASIKKTK